MNSFEGLVDFTLPEFDAGGAWSLLVDTNIPDLTSEPPFKFGSQYQVTGRSLLLFALNPAP